MQEHSGQHRSWDSSPWVTWPLRIGWWLLVSYFVIIVCVLTLALAAGVEEPADRFFAMSDKYLAPFLIPAFGAYFASQAVRNIYLIYRLREKSAFQLDLALWGCVSLFCSWYLLYQALTYWFAFEPTYWSPFWSGAEPIWVNFSWFVEGTVELIIEAFDINFRGAEATQHMIAFNTLELVARIGWGAWTAYVVATLIVRVRGLFGGNGLG